MPDLPLLGFRNYWYPLIESRHLRGKPVPRRILGEDLVVFRSGGVVGALADRCPHRGARLSDGRMLFPGSLSCGYHGWTFDTQGQCLAAIVEGPASRIPGKVQVKRYAVEERFGMVWVFMGEDAPPPLSEDLPPQILEPGGEPELRFEDWSCNWRNVTENYPDMLHAPLVHRTSAIMLFQKLPVWGRLGVSPLPDGRGLRTIAEAGALQATYRGLGTFPRHVWWRVLSRRRPEKGSPAEIRMPGYIAVLKRESYFDFDYFDIQWPVPVDEHHTRVMLCNITYPHNSLHRLLLKAWFHTYYRRIHLQFIGQDRRQIEGQTYRNPEKLSASDAGIIQWRRLAPRIARRGPEERARATSRDAEA